MTIPSSIMAAAEEAAQAQSLSQEMKRYQKDFWVDDDISESFKAGVRWLFSHLLSLSEKEFDEATAEAMIKNQNMTLETMHSDALELMFDQHALDFAALMQAMASCG